MKYYFLFFRSIYKHFQVKTVVFVFICFGIVYIPATAAYYFVSLRLAKLAIDPIISQNLISLRNNKAQQVREYFDHKFQIIRLISQSSEVVKASNDFEDSIPFIEQDFLQSAEQQKKKLKNAKASLEEYYKFQFLPELSKTSSKREFSTEFLPQSKSGILLQYAYLVSDHFSPSQNSPIKKDVVNAYSNFHEKYQSYFKKIIEENSLTDLYLMDNKGNIIYSVEKKIDFATNINHSPFKQEGLSQAFLKVSKAERNQTIFVDFFPYSPSMGRPTAFIAAPIFDDNRRVGSLVVQLSSMDLSMQLNNNFKWVEDGLGQTGEILLAGLDGKTRTDTRKSFTDPDQYVKAHQGIDDGLLVNSYLKFRSDTYLRTLDSFVIKKAAEGHSGIGSYRNYYGNTVIGAYKPIKIKDTQWIIISEVSKDQSDPLTQSFQKVLGYASIIVVLVVLIPSAYSFAKFLLYPLHRFQSVFDKIKNTDDLSQQLRMIGTVEFNQLRDSFNNMIDSLRLSKKVIAESQNQIQESILVAQKIQMSYLSNYSLVKDYFNEIAIYWSPKDIVGGDFYWIKKIGSKVYVVCGDCTGHGVPGAFMSIVAISALDKIPDEVYNTSNLEGIVQLVHDNFSRALALSSTDSKIDDGFEASFLVFDDADQTVSFVGMGLNVLVVRPDRSVDILEGSKEPLGYNNEELLKIKSQKMAMDDSIFVAYTDGFPTQIGQTKHRMLGNKSIHQFLKDCQETSPHKILEFILDGFQRWQGNEVQRDDLTMLLIQPQLNRLID